MCVVYSNLIYTHFNIQTNTHTQIVQADEVVFFGLLNDLFPELNPPRVFDEELSECISSGTRV
jgi:hypothetical protein